MLSVHVSVIEFQMTVRAADFPDEDRLKLGDRKYVLLYAKVGNTEKETKILMSNKVANVFVQTDKPLYTPGQQGTFVNAVIF